MKFLDAVTNLINATENSNENKVTFLAFIQDKKNEFTNNPRDNFLTNQQLQYIVLDTLMKHAEGLYGKSDDSEVNPFPIFLDQSPNFLDQPNSEIYKLDSENIL